MSLWILQVVSKACDLGVVVGIMVLDENQSWTVVISQNYSLSVFVGIEEDTKIWIIYCLWLRILDCLSFRRYCLHLLWYLIPKTKVWSSICCYSDWIMHKGFLFGPQWFCGNGFVLSVKGNASNNCFHNNILNNPSKTNFVLSTNESLIEHLLF